MCLRRERAVFYGIAHSQPRCHSDIESGTQGPKVRLGNRGRKKNQEKKRQSEKKNEK